MDVDCTDLVQHRVHWELKQMKYRAARELYHELDYAFGITRMDKKGSYVNLNKHLRIKKLEAVKVDVGKFEEFKKNPDTRSEYGQLNFN
jgi:hypothetical protein